MKRVRGDVHGQSREAARHGGLASSQRAGDMALARSLPEHFLIERGKIIFASAKARQVHDRIRRES